MMFICLKYGEHNIKKEHNKVQNIMTECIFYQIWLENCYLK